MSLEPNTEKTIKYMTGVLALVAGIFSLIVTIVSDDLPSLFEAEPASFSVTDEQEAQLRRVVEQIKQRQEQLRAQQQVPEPLAVLQTRLDQIEARQERLERVIMDDPGKALELPLLRRDIQSLKETQTIGLEAARQSVGQVYDLSKWLIGAMALGVISLAVNTFMRRRGGVD